MFLIALYLLCDVIPRRCQLLPLYRSPRILGGGGGYVRVSFRRHDTTFTSIFFCWFFSTYCNVFFFLSYLLCINISHQNINKCNSLLTLRPLSLTRSLRVCLWYPLQLPLTSKNLGFRPPPPYCCSSSLKEPYADMKLKRDTSLTSLSLFLLLFGVTALKKETVSQ